jgi:hypothetical protein
MISAHRQANPQTNGLLVETLHLPSLAAWLFNKNSQNEKARHRATLSCNWAHRSADRISGVGCAKICDLLALLSV